MQPDRTHEPLHTSIDVHSFGANAWVETVHRTETCRSLACEESVTVRRGIMRDSGTPMDGHVVIPGAPLCEKCQIRARIRQDTIDQQKRATDAEMQRLLPRERTQLKLVTPLDPYAQIPPRLRTASWEISVAEHRREAHMLDGWHVEPESVFIHGEQGRGKTMLLAAAAKRLVDFAPHTTLAFENVSIFLDRIRRTQNTPEKTDQLIDRLVSVDVLVLDDLGAEQVSRWTLDRLYVVLEERILANRATAFTSQFDLRGLAEHMMFGKDQDDPGRANSVKRIVSRIAGECRVIGPLGGADRRLTGVNR